MTISELIAELRSLPPELTVLIHVGDGCCTDVDRAEPIHPAILSLQYGIHTEDVCVVLSADD